LIAKHASRQNLIKGLPLHLMQQDLYTNSNMAKDLSLEMHPLIQSACWQQEDRILLGQNFYW